MCYATTSNNKIIKMSSTFSGFSEDDLQRIKLGETGSNSGKYEFILSYSISNISISNYSSPLIHYLYNTLISFLKHLNAYYRVVRKLFKRYVGSRKTYVDRENMYCMISSQCNSSSWYKKKLLPY